MTKRVSRRSKNLFLESVTSIRDELTNYAKELASSPDSITMDSAKLIKEITTVIKELDKLIREHQDESRGLENSDFYTLLKSRSLLDENLQSNEL